MILVNLNSSFMYGSARRFCPEPPFDAVIAPSINGRTAELTRKVVRITSAPLLSFRSAETDAINAPEIITHRAANIKTIAAGIFKSDERIKPAMNPPRYICPSPPRFMFPHLSATEEPSPAIIKKAAELSIVPK